MNMMVSCSFVLFCFNWDVGYKKPCKALWLPMGLHALRRSQRKATVGCGAVGRGETP